MSKKQNKHYTENSIVNKMKDKIDELVEAHWEYQEKLLSIGQDKTQTFTWEQVMLIREWDYTSSAKHFFGHGYEQALEYKKEQQQYNETIKRSFP